MPALDDLTRFRHMLQASEKALELSAGKTRADLDTDPMLGLALVRLLEVVGEASWGVSAQLRSRYPQIAWRKLTGMRNRLIHGYFDVN